MAEALRRGHYVRAIVRRETAFDRHPQLTVEKMSTGNHKELARRVSDADAVISVVSTWKSKKAHLVSKVAQDVLACHPKQFIGLTGVDALVPGEQFRGLRKVSCRFAQLIAKDVLWDGDELLRLCAPHENAVVLRSPAMRGGAKRRYRLLKSVKNIFRLVTRKMVACALLDSAEKPNQSPKFPFIV